MLFWLPEDDLAETGETLSLLNLGGDVPTPLFDRGGQNCGIISDKTRLANIPHCGPKNKGQGRIIMRLSYGLARRLFALRWAISMRTLAFPAIVIYGLAVNPTTGSGGIPCLWRLIFGVECPGCGLSRAAALLFRGHVHSAVEMNWLILPVVVIAIYCFTKSIVNHHRMRRILWPN